MPYTHKKVGDKYVVYKDGKKVGSTAGNKIALDKYLAALHINADKDSKKESKETKKKSIKEGLEEPIIAGETNPYEHPGCEDTVGAIHVVLKPTPESAPEDLVHSSHAFGVGQFEPSSVHGVYQDENEAHMVAETAVKDLHKHLHAVESKKDQVLDEIAKRIDKLQREVGEHMHNATTKPDESDAHHMLAEKKMAIIKNLRDKHKMVKASKRELPQQKD